MKKNVLYLFIVGVLLTNCDLAYYKPIKVSPNYLEVDYQSQTVEFTTDVDYYRFYIMRQTNDEEMGERENADTCVIRWGDGYFAYGLSSDRKKIIIELEENNMANDRELEIIVSTACVGADTAILVQKSKPQ